VILPVATPVLTTDVKTAVVGAVDELNVSSPSQQVEAPVHNVDATGVCVFAGAYVTTIESPYAIEAAPAPISAISANLTPLFAPSNLMRKTLFP
jgi:hypothetical protein